MSINNPPCPSGCSAILPVMDFDFCDPEVHYGEITKIFLMAYDGDNLLNWENLNEWVSRISNTDIADKDKIRELTVSADLPAAEQEDVIISNYRRVSTPKTFTLNVDIDETSEDNYEWMRTMECGTLVKMWFATDDLLFGGNVGIPVNAKFNYVIERGKKSVQKIMGTFIWDYDYSPERTTNPMA